MRRARVLVVDDSAAVRRLLVELLAAEPELEVSAARNGEEALALVRTLRPDVVTLDVEMPGLSGLDLLVELRREAPRLPVVMFSSLTRRAAETTLEALARGATDCVAKPAGTDRAAATEHVRLQLVPKVKVLAERLAGDLPALALLPAREPPPRGLDAPPFAAAAPPLSAGASRVDVLAVGCSTGGPNALAALFAGLPAGFPVPIVVVQHMPPIFTDLLARRLDAACALEFREARDGDRLLPGLALVAPGDRHLEVVRDPQGARVRLQQEAPENSCRPAVDVMFRTVAEAFAGRALGVVLTGMGQDGLRGAERLRALGGRVIVQDEPTSVVWGMPGAVARAGLADRVLPIGELAGEILRRIGPGGSAAAGGIDGQARHAG